VHSKITLLVPYIIHTLGGKNLLGFNTRTNSKGNRFCSCGTEAVAVIHPIDDSWASSFGCCTLMGMSSCPRTECPLRCHLADTTTGSLSSPTGQQKKQNQFIYLENLYSTKSRVPLGGASSPTIAIQDRFAYVLYRI